MMNQPVLCRLESKCGRATRWFPASIPKFLRSRRSWRSAGDPASRWCRGSPWTRGSSTVVLRRQASGTSSENFKNRYNGDRSIARWHDLSSVNAFAFGLQIVVDRKEWHTQLLSTAILRYDHARLMILFVSHRQMSQKTNKTSTIECAGWL